MKILVAEKIADTGIGMLMAAGHQVDVILDLSAEDLLQVIGGYDALIVRSATQANREVIETAVNLKVIGRAGVGVDNVDVEAATEHGVIVCNAPTSNVVSAAEQTMALMLAVARRTPQANASMKQGLWERNKFTGNELYQKTLAIFGIGRIGGLVAARARSFEMRCIGYDPYATQERADEIGVALYDNIDDILPQADFITVHLPKTKETIGMFGPDQFAKMKDGVYLVNAARGGIYDELALADAIRSGKVAGAGIDVYATEPCTESPLHELDAAVLVPHLGASTVEAQERAGIQIAEYVNLGLEGRMVPTAVNVPLVPDDVMTAVRPFVEAAQTAGVFLAQLAGGAIESLTVRVFGDLAKNDCTLLGSAALRGVFSLFSDAPVNFVNASYIAEQRGVKVRVETSEMRTEYASKVTFEARCGAESYEVSITTFGSYDTVRIISVMGFMLDLIPKKYIYIVSYPDRPGQLGRIGTMLGEAGINISTMEIGIREDSDRVLVMMNVDDPIDTELRARIDASVGSERGWFIQL
ncbi:MAG: phosphoglycerate dehydrogenase [Coriobacteriales bacterium]|jgi:D-3-phosphoglycerate dehydrogenase|nr:phosphoglycerate dehydrogenase [Coriobacteriales bacterium]